MLEGTIIDPAIRKQLTRQYREWNNARSKLKGDLKCNGCKNYFPRDEVTRVYPGVSNKYNVYCQPCLERRIARTGDRRGIETRYFSVGER